LCRSTYIEMTEDSKPWHAAFPAPRTTTPVITREEVLEDLSSHDLLLVDVRRTDFEGGTIKGSLNLPAHSFYMNRAVLFDLCKRAGVKRVAFYCGECDVSLIVLTDAAVEEWCEHCDTLPQP
jgi:arsenical-resistance protein 2